MYISYPKSTRSSSPHPNADNEYETVPSHTQPEDGRVVTDGSPVHGHDESPISTVPAVPEKGSDVHQPPPPPLPPECEADLSVSAYAVTVVSSSCKAPPPPAADQVVYFEVSGYQNQEVHVLCWFNPRQN